MGTNLGVNALPITALTMTFSGSSICIGGAWKDISEMYICIGGAWKSLDYANICISSSWKMVL